MKKYKHQMRGISTGFHHLDMLTKGLCEGNLILLAGRPPMRKIVFAMNIAEYAALTDGLPVAVFLMEKDAAQMTSRLLTKTESIDQANQSIEPCNDKSTQNDGHGGFVIHSGPDNLYVQASPELSVYQLRRRLQLLTLQYGQLGLIVLDSLQLMRYTSSLQGPSMTYDLCSLANDLKLVAMEFQCPMLVLSDLPEKTDARTYKRPKIRDLRTWGDIDQIADVILFIYRDDFYNKNSLDPGITEITVFKNVNGLVGKVKLAFQQAQPQRFLSLHSEIDDF